MPVETRYARSTRPRTRGLLPIILLILVLAPSAIGSAAEPPSGGDGAVALTQAERTWIAEHPAVRLMPDPLFPPFEYFDEDGTFLGIGADFVALLEKKLGIRFDVIRVKNWQESVAKTKNRENDLWSVVARTPQRSEYMLFTKPYFESPAVIVVRSDISRRLAVDDLKGMKVTVSSGYAVHEILKDRYPDMAFDPVPDPLTGLKKVSFGMADAMVINVALASHLMEKAGISNLHMAGEVGFTYRWSFASRSDWPELHAILEKGLAQITPEERQAITRKWVALKDQPFALTKTFVFSVLGVLVVLGVAGVLLWNQSLKRQIRLRTQEVEIELAERKAAETALRNSEELLSTAIESISDGFLMSDAEDRIVLSNKNFRTMYPNSHDLIYKGARLEDFLRGGAERGEYPDSGDQIDEWLANRMEEIAKSSSVIEERLIGDRWIRAASRRLPDGRRVSIHVDLTEIKQAQEDLQNKTDLVQLLRRTARDANNARTLEQAIQDALADVCAYNGWPLGHAYILSPEDSDVLVPSCIWHIDDPERFATFREVTEKTTFEAGVGLPGRVMASGEPDWIVDVTKDTNFPRAKLADNIGVKSGFACPVLAGSQVVAVLEFFAPNVIEPDQTLLDSLVQVGTQLGRVYERERAEKELRASQAELAQKSDVLQTVVESMPEGVVAFDKDLKLIVWNKNFLDIRGFPSEIAQEDWDFSDFMRHDAERQEFGPGDPEEIVQHQIERAKKFLPHKFERQRPNGRFIMVQGGAMPGGGFVSTYTDVTERKEAEAKIEAQRDELEDLNQQKDKLFSIIAHDLKSPFTSLLGLSQIMAQLSDKLTLEQFVEYAKSINESGQRLFGLLENLLEWARSQMDQVAFEPGRQDWAELVGQSVSLLSDAAKEKKVRLVSDVPQLAARADRHMADTVVRNLLTNAIKFTEESGCVTISAERKDGWVETTVTDTGVGMAPERLESVFQVGSAQSTKGTRGETGTGLGLPLCKDFVERHGGTIDVASKPGEGSSFCFTLPLDPN